MKSRSIRFIYILAPSHSGSTLLAMLLGSHPAVCTAGELKANALGRAEDYPCSCRRGIMECPFWTGVRTDLADKGHSLDFDRLGTDFQSSPSGYVRFLMRPLYRGGRLEWCRDKALLLSPTWRREKELIGRKNIALIEALLARTRKSVIVDSSKTGLRLKYLRQLKELDIRILRLVRDGRAVALTYLDPSRYADAQAPAARGAGAEPERFSERLSMERAARVWQRSHEEAEALLQQFDPDRWREVRYERLCGEPAEVLRELAVFIGVDPSRAVLDFRADEKHVIGNGMRLDGHSEIHLDERWRDALSADQLETFNSIAGRMNERLGYSS